MVISPPSSLAASPQYTAGSNARLFQPPKSPASTNVTPSFSNTGDYFSSAASRKRLRPDSSRAHDHRFETQSQSHPRNTRPTAWTDTTNWQCPTPGDAVYGSPFEQDTSFVNERYRLAGGFDTPSLRQEPVIEHEHAFRRRLRDDDMDRFVGGDCAFGPLARERNGAGRVTSSGSNESSKNTWTGLAFGAIGIVGKVFSFGTTVVRGFYAGGGKGYDLNNQGRGRSGSVSPDTLLNQAAASSIPGSWANEDDELLGDCQQDSPYFPSAVQERPPNKRRQTDRDEWVVIGTPDMDEGTTSGLKRRISSNNVPRSSLGSTASRAPSRRSIAPVTRRPSSYANVNGSPAQRTLLSTGGSSRRASIASPRSPQTHARPSSGGSGGYTMSPEAERIAKRQAKQERQVDKTMSSMEQRMKTMIQQAQQALGTKYSVEGDDTNMDMADDGFSSDEGW